MDRNVSDQRIDQNLAQLALSADLLDKQEEYDLIRRWQNERDPAALEALMSAYLRLVISAASKYRHYGLAGNDLVQEGCLGLIQAADRFDIERDLRFSTYSNWWIRSAMQDFILRNWSIVRTGTTAAQKKLFFNLRRLRSRIGQETGNDAAASISTDTREKIVTQLGVKPEEVDYMEVRLSAGDQSFNAPVQEDGENEWQDLWRDDRPVPEEVVMNQRDAEKRQNWLRDALQNLNERERLIVEERRLSEDAVTLAVLGKRLGISKERVRQIEHQALKKLRSSLTRIVGDPHTSGLIPSA